MGAVTREATYSFIAFAAAALQRPPVKHLQTCPRVSDDSGIRQPGANLAHSGTPQSENFRYRLLGDLKPVTRYPVMGMQEPPTNTLLCYMETITCNSLHRLRNEEFRVPKHSLTNAWIKVQCLIKVLYGDPGSIAGDLYDRPTDCVASTHQEHEAEEALQPYRRLFNAPAILHDGHK